MQPYPAIFCALRPTHNARSIVKSSDMPNLPLVASQVVWIELRRACAVGSDGDSLDFPRGLSSAPVAQTIPQASGVIPASRISQVPVGDHDFPSRPSRSRVG